MIKHNYILTSKIKITDILNKYGSPIYLYDEVGLKETAKNLKESFSWAKNYKNYFAVKATPTPEILKILNMEGMGFDCSSRAELEIMKRMKVSGKDIFYTSNNTPVEDFEFAMSLGATINIDDLTQIKAFIKLLGNKSYARVAVRLNPGNLQTGNSIIGQPTEAKYGVRLDQLNEAYKLLSNTNIKELGIHTMVASNERNPEYFAITARILKKAINQIESNTKVKIKFVNLGGGFGIPYSPVEKELDINKASQLIRQELGDFKGEIYTENGRYITGPNGYLVTKVRYVMDKYKKYVGIDASINNLMRPGMYGAYHKITVVGKVGRNNSIYDVVGSLCENNDKFAVDRKLPEIEKGDILIIHDAGAHGHSMGFNYNGLLKSGEVLLKRDGTTKLIRRPETVDDYLSTIIW